MDEFCNLFFGVIFFVFIEYCENKFILEIIVFWLFGMFWLLLDVNMLFGVIYVIFGCIVIVFFSIGRRKVFFNLFVICFKVFFVFLLLILCIVIKILFLVL